MYIYSIYACKCGCIYGYLHAYCKKYLPPSTSNTEKTDCQLTTEQKWIVSTWEDANASFNISGTQNLKTTKNWIHRYGAWARNTPERSLGIATPVRTRKALRWPPQRLMPARATDVRTQWTYEQHREPHARHHSARPWDTPWMARNIRIWLWVEALDDISIQFWPNTETPESRCGL